MCDTFAVGPSCTAEKIGIFGKNSDREPDEAHIVQVLPRREFPDNEPLQCTYVAIPQARSTHAILICKPFWIWGAEMGVNEKGVVIGNEALFTKVKPEKTAGLIGMDLLRLALERAASAEEAALVIIDLLKRYGQSGPCGYRDKKFTYMNSYLIMDRERILVLETLGRDHAVRTFRDSASISNGITLGRDWGRSSLPDGTDLNAYSDPIITYFSGSRFRGDKNRECIRDAEGRMGASHAFAMLRSHFGEAPLKGFNRDVCMHAADPLIRKSQTTGSLVVELHPQELFRIFVTAGSAPCLTTFKPFLPAVPFEDAGRAGASYSGDSSWWRHEAMHVNALFRDASVRRYITEKVREMEAEWTHAYRAHPWGCEDPSQVELSHGAFCRSDEADRMFLGRMKGRKGPGFSIHRLFWNSTARRTGIAVL